MRQAAHRFNNSLRYRDAKHERNTQLTPLYVLECVRADLGGTIGLDPCTEPTNPVEAQRYYTVDDDGLEQSWGWSPGWLPSVFANPPYAKAREPWVARCMEAGAIGQRVVLLIPAATDTRIWQRAVTSASAVVFIQGRVKFGTLRPNRRQEAASHPSCLIGWNTDLSTSAMLGLRVLT